MAELKPQIFHNRVMHKRLTPIENGFTYDSYALLMPLDQLSSLPLAYNRFGLASFFDKDHGDDSGKDLERWARDLLKRHGMDQANGPISLLAMPRIFGYVFNPISLWFCRDKAGDLRAVICEVRNTFGEKHIYLCRHEDQRKISSEDVLTAEKLFHVSPFIRREGHYRFRFDLREDRLGVWVDLFNPDDEKIFATSWTGKMAPLTRKTLRQTLWRYPLITFKTIWLIHWQALKLVLKGIKYIRRPKQCNPNESATNNNHINKTR